MVVPEEKALEALAGELGVGREFPVCSDELPGPPQYMVVSVCIEVSLSIPPEYVKLPVLPSGSSCAGTVETVDLHPCSLIYLLICGGTRR